MQLIFGTCVSAEVSVWAESVGSVYSETVETLLVSGSIRLQCNQLGCN